MQTISPLAKLLALEHLLAVAQGMSGRATVDGARDQWMAARELAARAAQPDARDKDGVLLRRRAEILYLRYRELQILSRLQTNIMTDIKRTKKG